MSDLLPGTYILNGSGDLLMHDGALRTYLNKSVECIKKCKSGLYYIKTHDGKYFTVYKRNLNTDEELNK